MDKINYYKYIKWLEKFIEKNSSINDMDIENFEFFNGFLDDDKSNILLFRRFCDVMLQFTNNSTIGITDYGVVKNFVVCYNNQFYEFTYFIMYDIYSCKMISYSDELVYTEFSDIVKNTNKGRKKVKVLR